MSHVNPKDTRRTVVKQLAFASGSLTLFGSSCRKPDSGQNAQVLVASPIAALLSLDAERFATMKAVTARLIPLDSSPGAVECGVPEYIDRMLATPALSRMKAQILSGLSALNRRSLRMFQSPFANATGAQQDTLLRLFKDADPKTGEAQLYQALLVLTLEGFLGDPSYGGNQGEVGWALVGFSLAKAGSAGAPPAGYDGRARVHSPTCGNGKGC